MRAGARRKAAIGLVVVLGLVAAYTLAGFFLVPYLGQRELARFAQAIDRHAEAARLSFNPYTWELEAQGVKLAERNGQAIAAVERLYADFDFTSVFGKAWRFDEVAVEGARLDVVIDRDGKLNLARLAGQISKPSPPAGGKSAPPAVVVGKLRLERAQVHFADRSRRKPLAAEVGPISAEVNDLSTLSGENGQYTLSAKLPDGATLSGKGNLSLQPVASAGELRLGDFKLATAWPFLRDRLRIAQPSGKATLQADYRYAPNGKPTLQVSRGDLVLEDVRLATAEGPLLELARGHAAGVRYDGNKAAVGAASIELVKGRYVAALDAQGRFNWAQLTTGGDPKKASGPWSARLDAIKLTDIAVRYEDRTRRTPLVLDIARGDATLRLALAGGNDAARTTAEDIRLQLKEVSLAQAGAHEPLATLAGAQLDGGRIDTREKLIAVGHAALEGGSAALLRSAEGRLPLARAFEPAQPAEPSSGPPWRYRIGAATLENARLAVGDASYEPALRYDLEIGRLAVKDVDPGSDAPLAFEAAVKAAQGGALTASGTAAQDYSRASAKLEVSGLAVQPLQSLLARHTTLAFRSGAASANAAVDYARDGKPMLRVTGGAKLAGVAIDDTQTRQRFMSLEQLTAAGATLTLSPDRLDIKEVVVDQPETAIHISRDRKVNLAEVLKETGAPPDKPAPRTAPAAKAEAAPAFPMRVGRLRVTNGILDFSDASLVLPFSTRVTRLNGTIVGLATDPQSRAELKFGGRIAPSGYASAEGGLSVLHPTEFMDINVKFQNVQMSPLSPYTATFAGRTIDSGRVWLDLDYKIVDKQLAGANKVLLDNVVLGKRVEAPNAMDLPLDLAIALLKDSHGRINLTVPVTGDIANPKFSYGALIRDAVASAIGRIVTAPFRALASLFGGGGGDELGKVSFSAGSARVYPPQRENLQKIAKALQERPQLKVVVHGAYDPARDAARLRLAPVRRALAQAMGQELKPGEDPGPIPYSDPDTQRAIEKLFVAGAGSDALKQFSAGYAAGPGKEAGAQGVDQRRAYYEAMFDRLVESRPLPDTALQQLAGERAQAIIAVLKEAGVDAGRIETGSLRTLTDAAEPTIDAELELSAR